MVLSGIGASSTRRPSAVSRSVGSQAADVESRALVPVRKIDAYERPSVFSRHPSAPFLAQLIATDRGEPQTRERRRAEPAAAVQAYAAALGLSGTIPRKN
jgi:hypothetical protein